jgi:hypothetical protein
MITLESIIRAGAIAQRKYNLKEGFAIRLFPSDCPETVRVYETPIAERATFPPSYNPYVDPPPHDDVKLSWFESSYNMDALRMGYSERLNILCLSLA